MLYREAFWRRRRSSYVLSASPTGFPWSILSATRAWDITGRLSMFTISRSCFLLTAFLWLSPSWYPQDWRESSIAMPGASFGRPRYATAAGAAAAAVIWFGADFFAREVFFMPYAAFALRTLAPTVWIMAYLGVLRGYFQGRGTMVPTAASQIFEQIVNAVVSVAAGSVLFNEALKVEILKGETGLGYSNAWGRRGGTIGTGAERLRPFCSCFFCSFFAERA